MTSEEKIAVGYLPPRLAERVVRDSAVYNSGISEIRLRVGRKMSLTIGGKNVICDMICEGGEISQTVSKICKGSLYSHSDSIRDGVITTEYGIRVGVAGYAVMNHGRIECVRDISSLNIRIPHRVKGAADKVFGLVNKYGSVLIYSLPGMGKTTILRELIPLLSSGEGARRVSVIDSRLELAAGIGEGELVDIFSGYPRDIAITQSIRTMSPEYIICDEISDQSDTAAILSAHAAGVKVIATAHAADKDGLMKNKNISSLVESGVFGYIYGIGEDGE
ncbi:MAG: hypothetical protein E7672_05660 [Ruminococcaceae bacterium]|nr:hypothetical protein [Oscillospiraceae bacterium]